MWEKFKKWLKGKDSAAALLACAIPPAFVVNLMLGGMDIIRNGNYLWFYVLTLAIAIAGGLLVALTSLFVFGDSNDDKKWPGYGSCS